MSEELPDVPHDLNQTASPVGDAVDKINIEQAQRFFQTVTQHPCPCCGGARWKFMVGMGREEDVRCALPIYLELNKDRGDSMKLRKMILIECLTCGFMRMHSSIVVNRWLESEGVEE